jgi:hypothetical protein
VATGRVVRSAEIQRRRPEASGTNGKGERARLDVGEYERLSYCLKTRGGPFISLASRAMVTSTWSAILMKGMPLFMP